MTDVVSSETGAAMIGCELAWRRDGADWVLFHKRRRMGRVVSDPEHPGMWRSLKSGGRVSDMANLSWAKNAVLEAATRELEYEARHRPVITPPKPQQMAPVFESGPPPVRYPVTPGSSTLQHLKPLYGLARVKIWNECVTQCTRNFVAVIFVVSVKSYGRYA